MAVTPGFAAAEVNVPEPLKPWVDWVLQDHEEELLCTTSYNDGDALKCDWPTSLDLDIREAPLGAAPLVPTGDARLGALD